MWHSLVLLIVCFATNALQWWPHASRWSYFLLWTVGLGAWAAVFWALRRRRGPVTFVERQIAHLWAGSMICTAMLFPLEAWMGFEPLTLSPVVPLFAATTFMVKAAILSGRFYLQALALVATCPAITLLPDYGHILFGLVAAGCFFVPGYRAYRASRDSTG